MRIVVIGTGAVGGYYGAMLAAGHDLVFVARGPHLEAMRQRGLRIVSHPQSRDWKVESAGYTDSPSGIADLVIIAVKSRDTVAALDIAAPCVGPDTLVMSMQNGVSNEDLLKARFGAERTVAGVAYVASEIMGPGLIEHRSRGDLVIGALPGVNLSRALERIREDFESCGVGVRISDNIMRDRWIKLTWNAAFNAYTALARCSAGDALRSPEGKEVLGMAMEEVAAVAAAEGYEIGEEVITSSLAADPERMDRVRPSMLQDAEKGRPLEHDALNGEVVARARRHGIPVPVNQTFHALLGSLDRQRGAG